MLGLSAGKIINRLFWMKQAQSSHARRARLVADGRQVTAAVLIWRQLLIEVDQRTG